MIWSQDSGQHNALFACLRDSALPQSAQSRCRSAVHLLRLPNAQNPSSPALLVNA